MIEMRTYLELWNDLLSDRESPRRYDYVSERELSQVLHEIQDHRRRVSVGRDLQREVDIYRLAELANSIGSVNN